MPKKRPLFWLLPAALLAGSTALAAQAPMPRVTPEAVGLAAEPLDGVTTLLEEVVAEGHLAGAVVGVARNGGVAYLEAVGVQDLGSGAPMTEASLFRIYSMTKAVTAVAVMMLVEEGLLELDAPVSRWIPELADVTVLDDSGGAREPARPITVRHLLLHTSGMSHRTSAEYRDARVRSRDIGLEQFVRNVVAVPLRFEPGEGYLYSESSTVLGRLIEVVMGTPFDAFLAERVFGPLGMDDTGFWVPPERAGRLTTVYRRADGGLVPYAIEEVPFTVRPALLEGAVGLVSTVPDFLRFAQMLANRGALGSVRLLEAGTVETMTTNGLPDEILRTRRGGTGWGLASVSVAPEGEYRWDGSAGTEFWVDPASGTVLVTMWQSSPANPESLRGRITELVREAIQP